MAEYEFNIEPLLFKLLDEMKFLFFPEEWSNSFLNFSKNEILTLLLIYKQREVNMTEVAECIHAPLNTATGIISRLEKQGIVERKRDQEDKRIVKISLSDKGFIQVKEDVKQLSDYLCEIDKVLTEDEKKVAYSIWLKAMGVLKQGKTQASQVQETKRVKRIVIE